VALAVRQIAAVNCQACSVSGVRTTHVNPIDRRQRLARKPMVPTVLQRRDLGGMAAQREEQCFRAMPRPSSSTRISRTPPARQAHRDLRRSGVQRVKQFARATEAGRLPPPRQRRDLVISSSGRWMDATGSLNVMKRQF
jgi:hypothetical protein